MVSDKLRTLKGVRVNFNLRQKTPANKATSIHCILRYDRQRVIIYDIDKVEPRNWNSKSQTVRGLQLSADGKRNINDFLKDHKAAFEKVFAEYIQTKKTYPDAAVLKELCLRLVNKEVIEENLPITDLIEFGRQFIKDTASGARLNPSTGKPMGAATISIYSNVVSSMQAFKELKKHNTALDNINLDFYAEYTDYLKFEKKYTTNTIAKYIKTIKTFMHEAKDRGFTSNEQFKSKRFKVVTEDTDTIYLSASELDKIYNLDLSTNSRLDRVRDLFLVGAWSGLRFSDYKDISPNNISGDFMTIKAVKTQKEVVIPIHDTIKSILEKYKDKTNNSLPPTISNVKMNEYIKEVAKEAGLNQIVEVKVTKAGRTLIKNVAKHTLITTHSARRSFATNMYLMGVPAITIMAVTGHKTEKAFMRYIRVTPDEHAQNMLAIWRRQTLKIATA